MIIQLSSGQGPSECELAVSRLYDTLKKEFNDIQMVKGCLGYEKGTYSSILFETDEELGFLEGSILWICRSPYRPGHKRKNWYIDVSVIPEIDKCGTGVQGEIRFERFHCGGNGGQNVNKVETGVRLIHVHTGITVTSTEERSQLMNRQTAMKKLEDILRRQADEERSKQENQAWREHTRIVRGNPVRIYEGMGFRLKM